jgi:hypothetical protein
METSWLVRAAYLAVVGSLTWSTQVQAQAPAQPPAKKATDDDAGPFAPKGKTGKLREAEEAENAPKPEPDAPPPKEPKYAAGANIVYGMGHSGSGTEAGSAALKYGVASFTLAATYQADPKINARFRFPISTGTIGEGAAAYNASAVGNIELGMTYMSEMGPHTKLPFDIGLYLPVASGDRFPPPEDPGRERSFRINTAAQWAHGLEEDALFAPHRLSLVPGLALRSSTGGISGGGFIKLPLMLRVGGGDPPSPAPAEGTFTMKGVVFEAVVGGEFRIDLAKNKMDIGVRAWLTWMSSEFIQRELTDSTGAPKLQFVAEPQFRATFGQLKGVLGIILPIEGRLAQGDLQNAYGFRLGAMYGF